MTVGDIVPRSFGKWLPKNRDDRNPFLGLRNEVDRLIEDFFKDFAMKPFEPAAAGFTPRIDVSEDAAAVKVAAELPGVEEKDIDLSISGDSLVIKGEKKEQKEEKGKGYYRTERSYGAFSRTIPIPSDIEQKKITAVFKNGVLTVTLPKCQQAAAGAKKVPIKTD